MNALKYIILNSNDPSFNLAAEQYIFDTFPRGETYYMLWQNRSSVIVGRYQNTYAEVNSDYVSAHGIRVVRRLSGGGTVYHDLGNLNYSIITDSGHPDALDLHAFCKPVVKTLCDLGADAQLSGRNDILVNGKKVSGNSQYLSRGRLLHHGTLLFDSDLAAMEQALCVDPSKIRAKGIPSIRSRVTNLKPCLPVEMDITQFRDLLLSSLIRDSQAEEYCLSAEDHLHIEKIRQDRYAQWSWNYGASPPCEIIRQERFENCGSIQAYLSVKDGKIEHLHFFGDFFSAEDPSALAGLLIGCDFTRASLHEKLQLIDVSRFFLGLEAHCLLDLLCGS